MGQIRSCKGSRAAYGTYNSSAPLPGNAEHSKLWEHDEPASKSSFPRKSRD